MSEANTTGAKPKLSVLQQVVCLLPIGLLVIGGAIGGLCGGAAVALNYSIMGNASMSLPMRYGLSVLSCVGAVVVWLGAIAALAIAFPQLFAH